MSSVAGGVDGVEVRFDEGCLVGDAGLLLAGTLMARLGLEALIDEVVAPPESGRGSGAKVLSLVASMLVGGSFIDDADRLRAGSAQAVLPFTVSAPSTLGTWLRSFTFGHVRQFDRAHELALGRAWSVGAAPDVAEMTVDLDSTVCEVFGKAKQGAAYGHTSVLGYHPLVAVRDDTGEVIHTRMRSGSSQRGHVRFAAETLARLARLAPRSAVTVRADAGFFSYDMIDKLEAHDARWSITVPQNAKVKAAIDGIDEAAWTPIAYTTGGEAQVAETTITTGPRSRSREPRTLRLVVRRSRLTGPQNTLWPNWRHHCLVTNRADLTTEAADAYHRAHARVELTIRDLKDNGLAHCLRELLRQRRLARLRRIRPQPHPLDHTPRTHHPPPKTHRRRHHPPKAAHRARKTRQPQPPTHPAPTRELALGHALHHSTATPPQPPPAHLTTRPPGPGASQPNTPSATNPTTPQN